MINRYMFGNPIPTQATVKQIDINREPVPYFDISGGDANPLVIRYTMGKEDIVYGLGESMRGMNKRGFLYKSMCSDDPVHTEDKSSLYGAHNFILINGVIKVALFVDNPGEVDFDIGYTDKKQIAITVYSGDADLYVITGKDCRTIIHEFRELIGKSYIPPKWGMGYGQSRWSYPDEESVENVVDQYQKHNIPIDSIYLDIDYMDHYKDFTISTNNFPDFPLFVEKMKKKGIHLVPIIDAGVKIESGYKVYEEGTEKGYFCKKKDGTYYVAGVWPGRVHFPDFLNKDAREWFGNQYQILLDQGIDGFWNDMNEPAIFYSEDRLHQVFDELKEFKNTDLPLDEFWRFTGLVSNLQNNKEDYKTFYHNYDGKLVRHDQVHNIYGFYMTRAASESFDKMEPDKRILLFSRSSYIGMHRYGGIWTGDNQSWWSHILQSIRQMVGLNMCGILYTGSDIGGFGSNATEDLVLRFTEWGIFTPLMRNHSALGTRSQEAYSFTQTESFANIIDLRYFLMPYLYSEYMRAALKDEMYFYPLSFLYPFDNMAAQVEDQLFVGESMMIAPIYVQNARGRYVYLPEPMKLYRFRSRDDFDVELVEEGHHYFNCECEEVLIFIRPGHFIPCAFSNKRASNIEDVSNQEFILLSNAAEESEYILYTDDGLTKNYYAKQNECVIRLDEDGNVSIDEKSNTVSNKEIKKIY